MEAFCALGVEIVSARSASSAALSNPREGEIRVFYDVTETQVQVLAIVTKADAQAWLDEQGRPNQKIQGGGFRGSEG